MIVLQTERLVVRRFTEDDGEHLLRLESDPEVMRHLGRGPFGTSADDYRRHIQERFLPYYARPEGYGGWALLERRGGEFIGVCSLKPALDSRLAKEMEYGPDEVELGYGLRRASWGRGYATEMAQALVQRAFAELGAARLVASVSVANGASMRVLEKAGLRRLETLYWVPGETEASAKYALNRDRFEGLRLSGGPVSPR
jgi:RimJ/RimL family protein N-acetyltransferase